MKGDTMAADMLIEKCPKCNAEMEQGFVGTEQKGGGLLGGLKCSKVLWCEEFKMGFFGSPKGADISGQNTHKKYMAIPAVRCTGCRLVVFAY
jgi:hypothetical protein